jgi:hypothetical protein
MLHTTRIHAASDLRNQRMVLFTLYNTMTNLTRALGVFLTFDESRMSRQRELSPSTARGRAFRENPAFSWFSFPRSESLMASLFRRETTHRGKERPQGKQRMQRRSVSFFFSSSRLFGFMRRLGKPFSRHGVEVSWSEPDAERACVRAGSPPGHTFAS